MAENIIEKIEIWPVDIEMTDNFVISKGEVPIAKNLFIELTLDSDIKGYGEIAPFKDLTGEDRETSLKSSIHLVDDLIGKNANDYLELSNQMTTKEPNQPAARCGLETAIVDALARSQKIPLWKFFGGTFVEALETDITIPILEDERSIELARFWIRKGFRTIKLKVGKNIGREIEIAKKITSACCGASLILDANGAFSETEAKKFIAEMKKLEIRVRLFEQPVDKDDLEAMARLNHELDVPIAADESVNSLAKLEEIIKADAAEIINLKITKSGLFEAKRIAERAEEAGLGLMYGGMVETRLAMGTSLALAIGMGNPSFLDLDTPLLMREDPVKGGYFYDGPFMQVWKGPGLDMEPISIP